MGILRKKLILTVVFYWSVFQLFNLVWAQIDTSYSQNSNNSSYQYYLEPGTENRLMMKVNVWGEVKKPGTQYVPDKTDLVSVISFAGGPTENAKLSKIKLVRNFPQEQRTLVINLKDYLKNGESEEIPMIKPGDTIIVPKSSFFSFSRYVSFLYNVAFIASVVALISNR